MKYLSLYITLVSSAKALLIMVHPLLLCNYSRSMINIIIDFNLALKKKTSSVQEEYNFLFCLTFNESM